MKVLVTGGAGFIGSHLVDRLLAEGHEVTVIDNLNTGKRSNLTRHHNLRFYLGNILDNVNEHFRDKDWVFHLAALTRPQWSIKNPIESNVVNVEGTLKVLERSKNNKVKRVVFTSSSSLYGIPETFPTKEDEPCRALSPYGLQKYMGEQYCQLYERMYGLEVNCIRPFNVYGFRQNPEGGYAAAVPKFIDNLSKNKPGNITGDGKQKRDFTYVDDVVDMLMLAAKSPVHGESFNCGAGRSVTINYLYKTIAKIMKKDIDPIHIDKVFEPRKTLADTSKAKEMLWWEPKTKLEDGLKLTIKRTLDETKDRRRFR